MAPLAFNFLPSKSSNDHQARVLVNGVDILSTIDKTALGLDPVEFFAQEALRKSGVLLIGRCNCGCIGCCDVPVEVQRNSDTVEWHTKHGLVQKLVFQVCAYDISIEAGALDISWETIERTAERLVSKLDFSPVTKEGYMFDWASGRIAKDKITLSFSRDKKQQLVDAPWDHHDPATAVTAVCELLSRWPTSAPQK